MATDPPHKRKPAALRPTGSKSKSSAPTRGHFADSLEPQTPLGVPTPVRTGFQFPPRSPTPEPRVSPLLRWAVEPAESLPILAIPFLLYLNWALLAPHIAPLLSHLGLSPASSELKRDNPFAPFLFLSHRLAEDANTYAAGPLDALFVAYHVVAFSLLRQTVTLTLAPRVGRYFGIVRRAKLARFGEQGYAVLYFGVFGAWGVHIMSQLPTWWYRTEYFWIDHPLPLPAPLKRYYLLQTAYWLQQALVLILGLEKRRKDYAELVAHHVVTLWLVITSYIMGLTLVGHAVFMSMDIPDMLLSLSKLLNYLQWNRTNNFVLAAFVGAWTYFRHYLNLWILWSIWAELDRHVTPTALPPPVRWGAFAALVALQLLNLFWYYLIVRIVVRAILTSKAEDERSDGEDDGEEEDVGMGAGGEEKNNSNVPTANGDGKTIDTAPGEKEYVDDSRGETEHNTRGDN